MKIFSITLFMILAVVWSCNKEKTAHDALVNFISYRFDEDQNRDTLLEKTHGRLKNVIASMNEEEFKKFITVDKLEKKSFKILLENCKDNTCFITYNLNYFDYKTEKKKEPKFSIEVKKMAKLEKIEKEWLVSDVQNIKTYIDSKEKIDITDKDIIEKN